MSRRKKETLTRRDFLKATGIMAGSILLSACSKILQAPASTLSPSLTSTETPFPMLAQTPSPTSTSTPMPSPTPKPKPWTVEYKISTQTFEMKIPFTTVDGIGEVVNFENWRELPELKDIAYLPYYHDALLKAVKSDRTPLVKPFPIDVEVPKWEFPFPNQPDTPQGLEITFPLCEYSRQPLIIVGGFRLHMPLVDPSSDNWYGGITVLSVNPSNIEELLPVSALVGVNSFSRWQSLNKSVLYPKPRIGIPKDIKTNSDAAALDMFNHIAFYMSQIGAYNPNTYTNGILDWEEHDFPPKTFHTYPYIASVEQLSNQH